MALASNQRHQMAKRLQADIQLSCPEYTVNPSDSAGDPQLEVLNSGGDNVAIIQIKRRTFSGFNVVAELSSDSAQGLPEHELWLDLADDLTFDKIAKLVKASTDMGASSTKVLSTDSAGDLDATDMTDANVLVEIPNNARLGATGN